MSIGKVPGFLQLDNSSIAVLLSPLQAEICGVNRYTEAEFARNLNVALGFL